MMKKLSLAAFLLIAVTAFSLLLSLAMLAAPSGDCGNNITYTVTDGALVLSGSGSMNDYTPSTLPWGDEAVFITSLTIPEGITSIGIDAFLNLSVSKVTIPESVILIGSNALGYSYYEGTYRALSDFTIVGKRGSAAETYATQNGFDFEAISPALPSGSCGQSVTWSLSEDGVLTISGNGPMADYGSSATTPWADYVSGKDGLRITAVVIESGVTSVGKYAFASCRRLSSVSIASGVTSIGVGAFSGCSDLTSISLPGSVTTVGAQAFSACISLSDVTFVSGTTTIDSEAFTLTAISSLNLPATLSQIGDKAFYGCTSLTTANLPGLTKLGNKAFEGCTALGTVTFPKVVTIGRSAFEGCSALSSVPLPASLTTIGSRAFYACTSLGAVTIPDGVTRLAEYAYYGAGLASVKVGKGIAQLEECVFENCASLSSVTLSNSVTAIGERAFSGCSSLTSILLPKGVRTIADKSLGYVYDEDTGTYRKFTEFTLEIKGYIPSVSKQYAEAHAFQFTSLGTVDIDGGNVSGSITWSINTETGVLMVNGSGKMPSYASFADTPWFLYKTYIKTIVIGQGITEIGSSSFEGCSLVTSLTVSGTVKTIGDYAFAGVSITKLALPASVTSLGDSAFEGCASLKSVTLPDKLQTIGQSAFRAPNELTSIYIPEGVTYIGANAIGVTEGNAPIFNFVIRGVAGSIAEDYAKHNGLTFRVDGFIEVTDTVSGASVTILGEDTGRYVLTLKKISDSLSPAVLLAGNEYALLYNIQLMNGNEDAVLEGTAEIRFPIPSGVNSLAAKVFAYDASGAFTEIEATVENGYFIFRHFSLGNFVITNASLDKLITITVYHSFADGSEASPTELILATIGANYSVKPVLLDGYKANHNTLSGKVEGSFSLTFTYHEESSLTTGDDSSAETDTPGVKPKPKKDPYQILLIILEVVLILALIAAVIALIILNTKKKKEENEKDTIAVEAAKDAGKVDKFAKTMVVPDLPTQEIDIQSLFADEPEEDTAAIEEILKNSSLKDNSQNK